MVLGTAALLVVAIARLLGDHSDGSSADGGEAARLAAEVSTPAASSKPPSTAASPPTSSAPTVQAPTSTAPVLATPDGPCVGSDVAVTPKVTGAVAGRDVMIVLEVRTISAEACTWRVSPDALAISITSGSDRIWSSRACPRAVNGGEIVVRKDVTANVGVVWKQAKRSDETCSPRGGWALPGWYHVTAAALGGEPSDLQFELTAPTAITVTRTATPKQQPTRSPSGAGQPSSTDG
jgi:hypothetical protein